MAFGVTDQGFVAKRLADIKVEVENAIKATFGTGVNFDPRGPFGQLVGIFSEREALIWELVEEVYNSYWPETASGASLDNALSLVGLERRAATQSKVDLKFFAQAGTVIPANTEVSRSDDSTIVFETIEEITVLAGTGSDEVQNLSFGSTPDAGSFSIEFDLQVTSPILFSDNAAAVQSSLEALSNIGAGNVSVAGDFASGFDITFQGALAETPVVLISIDSNSLTDSGSPVTITESVTTEGEFPNGTVEALSVDTGPIPAPSGTLDTLDSGPIAGFESVTNPLDAELGTNIETDAEAKARRIEAIANPGNATLQAIRARLLEVSDVVAVNMFENIDLVEDLRGRPGKSYEAVVQGGDDEDIAQVLFDTKPAGIEQFGSVTFDVTDSQGVIRTQRFSRPDLIDIYLEVDLTVDGSFPTDGLSQAEQALLDFGNALNISDDVIIYPRLVCSLDEIPGILDIAIRVGVASIPASASLVVTSFTNDLGDLRVDFGAAHGLAIGNQVTFSNTGGSLPTGLNSNDVFWVVDAPSATQIKVSDTRGGDVVQFVNAGSGTNEMSFGGRDDNIIIEDTERADFDSSRITVVTV